ncbi:MAG TPA: prepilin-type N-terminal cleavage/methylation domain-containing protein [Candidatus Eisenbacteria bacterium]|nr:prepilin-type N-terminal cleavage/methylation domain-containing protein [Candidatus Eisenbacteria bacterium]
MNRKTRKLPAGFTMIELMIAMAVTMVILYAAVAAFKDAQQTSQVITQSADMTENLRNGLNFIIQDVQQAGTGIPTGGIPIPYTSNGSSTNPCGTTAAINRPILGGKGTFPPCNSVLPAVEPGSMLGPAITAPDASTGTVQNPNSITDEISVMYADNTAHLETSPIYAAKSVSPPSPGCPNGKLQLTGTLLQITFDPTCVTIGNAGIAIQPGDLILLNNSLGSALVYVTNVAGQTLSFASGDPYSLNGRSDTSGTVKQLMTSSTCNGSNACFPTTTAMRVWMISYYLDNISSPPYIRLVRQVNFNTPTPVGETLENLQFTYNFIDGVTNPASQATVPTGNSESQIRTVNVWLGARTAYLVHEGSNKSLFARNNIMTQISLRSMAYVNKYQ